MDLKRGKVFVGAVVAVTMGAFAVPFCSNAIASTGTTTPRQSSQLMQLAEEEHTELKEKTEDKAHELKSDAAAGANAVRSEHEEHEAAEANGANEAEEHGVMRHEMKEKAERHVDEM